MLLVSLSVLAGCNSEPKPYPGLVKICTETVTGASLAAYDKELDRVLRGTAIRLSHWRGGGITPYLWSVTIESSSGKFRTGVVLDVKDRPTCTIIGLVKPRKYPPGVG